MSEVSSHVTRANQKSSDTFSQASFETPDLLTRLETKWSAHGEKLFPKRFGAKLRAALEDARDDITSDRGRLSSESILRIQELWGNKGYAANAEYLGALSHLLAHQSGKTVLECGSGVTSLLLGLYGERYDFQVVSLEHSAHFHKRCTRALRTSSSLDERVQVAHTPLVDRGEYDWYDLSQVRLKSNVGLVVCDGPPGDTRGGRFGALPELLPYLRSNARILLDDALRTSELRTLEKWREEYGAQYQMIDGRRGYAIVRLGGL